MSTPVRRRASVLAVLPLLLAACATPYDDVEAYPDLPRGPGSLAIDRAAASANTRRVLERLWAEHIDAARVKDLDGVLALYADDIHYVVSGTELRGAAAMRAHESRSLAGADVHPGVEHTTLALSVHGDTAYELGTIVGPVRVHGQATRVVSFPFMARWTRGPDGRWRLQHLVGDTATD